MLDVKVYLGKQKRNKFIEVKKKCLSQGILENKIIEEVYFCQEKMLEVKVYRRKLKWKKFIQVKKIWLMSIKMYWKKGKLKMFEEVSKKETSQEKSLISR